jgi:hypothetical protein
MQRDELLNQLKSQDLATVNPTAFKQVGDPVFPDLNALGSLQAFGHIVEAFRHVHLPAYGGPIPRSSKVASIANDGSLLAMTGSAVAMVQAIQLVNASTDPVEVHINLNGILLLKQLAPGNETTTAPLPYPIYVDSAGPLTISNASASITTSATYLLTAQ